MAGRFQNTKYINTVNSITDTMTSLLDNPYYLFNDKKPFICIIYLMIKNLLYVII